MFIYSSDIYLLSCCFSLCKVCCIYIGLNGGTEIHFYVVVKTLYSVMLLLFARRFFQQDFIIRCF